MAKIQITGGGFQDSEGNVLANGYLKMVLSQDCQVASTAQICSGIEVTVPLDANGNVSGTVLVWPNDQLLPVNNFYTVTGYTAQGQRAWGSNVQQIIGAGPFNLNTWVPNTITSWVPSPNSIKLQTNEVNNGSQLLLDLHAGTAISLTDNGAGQITITNLKPAPLLQINETNNGSQLTLDLHSGPGVTLQDNGSGKVTVDSQTSGGKLLWRPFNAGNSSAPSGSAIGTAPAYVFAGIAQFHNMNPPQLTAPFLPAVFQQGTFAGDHGGACWDQWKMIAIPSLLDFSANVWTPLGGAVNGAEYWIGLTDVSEVGTTGNSSLVNTVFPTAHPAANFCGFRGSFHDGDTTWQAYCSTDATHFTIVDTGVTIDFGTNAVMHLFEFQPQNNGASVNFLIDGKQVATISTNIPNNALLGFIVLVTNNGVINGGSTPQATYGLEWLAMQTK